MKKSVLIALAGILILATFIINVRACGCGIAISDVKVFNSLKETQAYLMIDIKDKTSYNEMPFFRMVSMEEPYNVTIVFPIDGIPYDVQGKKITAAKFLEDYNIRDAEGYMEKQSFSGIMKKVRSDISASSKPLFLLSNGLPAAFFWLVSSRFLNTGSSKGMEEDYFSQGINPIAHFEFEGGSMDIYDVKSMETLGEFVKKINITLTGEVEKLVTKYNNYYVAVLYLNVPSALDSSSREQLKLCPEQTQKVKEALQQKAVFNYEEIQGLTRGICRVPLMQLVTSVTGADTNLNGTLVEMKFKDRNSFFYPTSVVNSYKYPVTDQKYFIKAPKDLNIKLDTSKVDKIASFNSERWYKISSTEEDIQGTIINAGTGIKISDTLRKVKETIYNAAWIIVLVFYLAILYVIFLFYSHLKGKEKLKAGDIGLTILMIFVGGLLLSSIVSFARKKWKFALALLSLWIILLLLMFV